MKTLPVLSGIKIASPCSMDWEQMSGDEQVRFCGACELHVYNLSGMTQAEAEALVMEREGKQRLCVRFYRRTDGTVLTRDCPVGLARVRRSLVRLWSRVAALFLATFTLFGCRSGGGEGCYAEMGEVEVMGKLMPPPPVKPAVTPKELGPTLHDLVDPG